MRKHESLGKRDRTGRACSCRTVHLGQTVLKRTKDDKIIVREEYHESPLRRTHPDTPVREVVLIFTTKVVKKFGSTKYLGKV